MEPAISISSLTRKFNDKLVVEGVSLEIPGSVVYGLLGPNDAGKTTTVRMLSALLKPTSGTARVNEFEGPRRPRLG